MPKISLLMNKKNSLKLINSADFVHDLHVSSYLFQDESKSNWLRNVRLDHTGFNYNLLKYVHDNKVYVVTAKHITAGTELILKAEDNILYKGNRVNLANISRKKHCELCDLDFSEEIYFKV